MSGESEASEQTGATTSEVSPGDASDTLDRALPEPTYEELIEAHEQRLSEQRLSAIEAGRRKGGVAGAAMAGAMLAVAEVYEGPRKDDKPVTVEASSDPEDVDRDGIDVAVGDVEVGSPALPSLEPVVDRVNARRRPQV